MEFSVLPYIEIPTIKDDILEDLYHKLVHEGIAKWLFFEGSINSSKAFVNHVKNPSVLTWVPMADRDKPMGIIFFDMIKSNTAYVHGAFFREFWGSQAKEVGRSIILKAIDSFDFNVLYGLVPKVNRMGIKFAKDIGGHFVGEIPNATMDGRNNKAVNGMLFYFDGGD